MQAQPATSRGETRLLRSRARAGSLRLEGIQQGRASRLRRWAWRVASLGPHAAAASAAARLARARIFFQGHCRFYFYFLFIFQAQAEIFRPIFLASRYHFSKFCQGCESEGRVDSVRARPRLRARLGGSEDSWWAFGEAVCVGASS